MEGDRGETAERERKGEREEIRREEGVKRIFEEGRSRKDRYG